MENDKPEHEDVFFFLFCFLRGWTGHLIRPSDYSCLRSGSGAFCSKLLRTWLSLLLHFDESLLLVTELDCRTMSRRNIHHQSHKKTVILTKVKHCMCPLNASTFALSYWSCESLIRWKCESCKHLLPINGFFLLSGLGLSRPDMKQPLKFCPCLIITDAKVLLLLLVFIPFVALIIMCKCYYLGL